MVQGGPAIQIGIVIATVVGLWIGARRVGLSERLVTEDLDAAVVEIETDLVGDLPEVLAVNQLNGIVIVVPLEPICVLLGRVRKSTSSGDHSPFWAVEVERRDGRVELLDDWPADGPRVLALNDDRPSRPIDDRGGCREWDDQSIQTIGVTRGTTGSAESGFDKVHTIYYACEHKRYLS